jgi:tRNA G10  N-methylase Trm11
VKGAPPHPATFPSRVLDILAEVLVGYQRILDPFAGVGGIHRLAEQGHTTVGIELEPEWAAAHPHTRVGTALRLRFGDDRFDAIATSPTYGNRLADSYNATDPESRHSYHHDLGHRPSKGSSAILQWGEAYRDFHQMAWTEATRVLRPGGRFALNIKDHYRNGVRQHVAEWHLLTLIQLGLCHRETVGVSTGGLGRHIGENANNRDLAELIVVFDNP